MDHVEDLHEAVAQILRSCGQRYTSSRRAVVEALERADRPVTLPEILSGNEDLAQSSAYRNLAELVDAGVVRRIITSDEYSHFEIADHLTGEHHHHLICTVCGAVEDFTVPNELEDLIDRASLAVADEQRWSVEHHRLDLVGRCATCA
jgi:Fur family transcriptional regulator, ferric uptake regulator